MSASASLYTDVATQDVFRFLNRIPDTDEVLRKLGMRRHDLRKLEFDDEISAALETRREAVVATPWSLDPYVTRQQKWLFDVLAENIERILSGAWSAIPYGYSVQEIVYEKGQRIGLAEVSEKPLEWFEPLHRNELKYNPANSSSVLVDTKYKFLLTVRQPTYRQPMGQSLLSRVYWPWFFRQNGWQYWLKFLARFSDPLLMGTVADPELFVSTLQRLGYQSVVGVGLTENITSVTHSTGGEFEKIDAALSASIQKVILGQTLTSQIGGNGSYAVAKVHNEVRDDKRRSDIRLVRKTVQTVVNALWTLNSFTGDPPVFAMKDNSGLDMERATRDATLANAGIVKFTEKYLASRYDLEKEDFELGESKAKSDDPKPKTDDPKDDPETKVVDSKTKVADPKEKVAEK